MLFVPGAPVRDGRARPAYASFWTRRIRPHPPRTGDAMLGSYPRGALEHKVVWLGEGRVMPSTRLSPGERRTPQ